MLKLANGLLKPTQGQILINGLTPGPATKSFVSYLPDANYLMDWMNVKTLVGFFKDFYQDFDERKAYELLANLGIPPEAPLKTLSKGNKEKVQLILAMSRRAYIYFLDEPIGGVDPAARDYILSTILRNYSENALAGILQFYFAMSLGNLSNKNKILFSVLAYLGINIAVSIVSGIIQFARMMIMQNALSAGAVFSILGWPTLILYAVLAIGFFFGTYMIMENKLNLE